MRKGLVTPTRQSDRDSDRDWVVLDEVTSVEVTSEAEDFPVEGALIGDGHQGWRADTPGSQTIRLLFDTPQTVRFIRLVFREEKSARTQEFVLRWLPAHGTDWRYVVRQQWNFNPPNSVLECEEYKVDLASAAALELTINPDISQVGLQASMETMAARRRARHQSLATEFLC